MSKIAKDVSETWGLFEKQDGKPHGWIQWKGTDVCMDFHCKCGHHSHIDAMFVYHIKCPECGIVYAMNGFVEAIEVADPKECHCVVTPELDED